MNKNILGIGALAVFVGVVPATAGVVLDSSLLSPSGTSGAPAVYYGNGNAGTNFGWSVDSENGIELGLQGLTRFIGPISPNGTANYITNVSSGALTPWDFAYSIDLQPTGSASTLTLADVRATITVTDANTGNVLHLDAIGNSGSVSPSLIPIGDDGVVSLTNFTGDNSKHPLAGTAPAFGAQNAENLGFFNGAPAIAAPWDFSQPDVYTVTLDVSTVAGSSLGSEAITITTVTPEPSTWLTLGTALLGVGMLVRRRRTA